MAAIDRICIVFQSLCRLRRAELARDVEAGGIRASPS